MENIATAEQFKELVAADKTVVAQFYAPWCGSCKMVTPLVESLAKELADKAAFVRLNGEDLEALFEELDVDSFPHFRVYKKNQVVGQYTGSKADKLEAFIREHTQ